MVYSRYQTLAIERRGAVLDIRMRAANGKLPTAGHDGHRELTQVWRDVNDDAQSYDQSEWYVQIRSQPIQPLYLSARYRDRKRDYQNVDRQDARKQISVGADYTVSPHLVLNLYGAREDVDSNLTGRDYDSGFWLAGVTWRF